MLKRSRAPSPSPTRADPSSPPPLDHNPHLPLPKRRRTVGPIIDSSERRDGAVEDDGEDDEDLDRKCDDEKISTPGGKVYEHVNHFLHCLHTENQHRSQSAQLQPGSSFTHPHSHITSPSTFILPCDSSSPCSTPFSSPAKYFRDSQSCSSPMTSWHHERIIPRDMETASGWSDTLCGMTQPIPNKTEVEGEDERIRVTQRYEDTNRFVHGIVAISTFTHLAVHFAGC